jgi:hypothetical protein
MAISDDLEPVEAFGEDGKGSKLIVAFDNWDNGGGEAPAIDIFWAGERIATQAMGAQGASTLDTDGWWPVHIELTSGGDLTLLYNDELIHDGVNIADFAPIENARVAFGGRTGGANANQFIDNFRIVFDATEVVSPFDAAIQADSPVHWYKFDEPEGSTTLVDHGSGGIDGEYIGGVEPGQEGATGAGEAALFPADPDTNDFVSFGDGATISGDWSAEFIVNKGNDTTSQALIDGPNTSIRLRSWGNSVAGVTQYGVADYLLEGAVAPVGEWVHIVFVKTDGVTKYYQNGELLAEGSFAVDLQMVTLSRDTTNASANDKLTGLLDEAIVYDVALTEEQVASHFAAIGLVAPEPLLPPELPWSVGRNDDGWPAGDGGGPNTSFMQETGTNELPGDPASPEVAQQADDDYYWAGDYSTVIAGNGDYEPVGLVEVNEEAAERAFAGTDNDLRYHFNLPESLQPTDRLTVSYDALNLHTDGQTDARYGIEVYVNNVQVQSEIVIRPDQLGQTYDTEPFTLADVNAEVGSGYDNILTLKGVNYNAEGGGNWMGIDYVQLSQAAPEGPVSILVDFGGAGEFGAGASPDPWITIDNLVLDQAASLGGGVTITALDDGFNPNNPAQPGEGAEYDGVSVPQEARNDYLFKIADAAGTTARMRIDGLAAGTYNVTVFEGRTTDASQFAKIWTGEEPAAENTGDFAKGSATVTVTVGAGEPLWYMHLEDGSGGVSGMMIRQAADTPTLSIVNNGDGTVTVTFEGKLQAAASVNGPWADVEGAVSPQIVPASEAMQYGRAVK